ncbi:MAG: PAS domain S-box protein [Candidatus Hydrogenedentota bacterium]
MALRPKARTTLLLRAGLWALGIGMFALLLSGNLLSWLTAKDLLQQLIKNETEEAAQHFSIQFDHYMEGCQRDLSYLGTVLTRHNAAHNLSLYRHRAKVMQQERSACRAIILRDDAGELLEITPPDFAEITLPRCHPPENAGQGDTPFAICAPMPFDERVFALHFDSTDSELGNRNLTMLLDIERIVANISQDFRNQQFSLSLKVPGGPRFSTAIPADTHARQWATTRKFTLLGGTWIATARHVNPALFQQMRWENTERLAINILLSLIATALLLYTFQSWYRLRQHRHALRETNERLELALRAGEVGVWDWFPMTDRVILGREWFARREFEDLDETLDQIDNWRDTLHPDDAPRVLEAVQENLDGSRVSLSEEVRVRGAGGTYFWILLVGRVAWRDSEGNPTRMIGIFTDISKRKQTDELHEHVTAVVENSDDAIIGLDCAGRVTSWNAGACHIYGYPRHEALGKPLATLCEGSPDMADVLKRVLRGQTLRHIEIACRHRSGAPMDLSFTLSPIRDAANSITGASCIACDITMRRATEVALRHSQRDLARAQKIARIGNWRWDFATREITWSEEIYRIFGVDRNTFDGNYKQYFFNAIHPGDYEKVRRQVRQLRTTHKPIASEFRIIRNGETRHITADTEYLSDDDGRHIGLIGTLQDITERKRAAAALRHETERAQHYLDIAGVMMIAIDADQRITLINRKGCQILGYEEHELLGANYIDTCLPLRLRQSMRTLFQELLRGEFEQMEAHENPVFTRSGEERIIAWRNSVLRNEAGAIAGVLSSGADITDQRRAEQAAKLREQQLIQADKMASLGILVSGVAHEINNPNAFILSNITSLHDVWEGIRPVLEEYHEENGDFLLGGVPYSKMRDRVPRLIDSMRDGAQRISVTVQELRGFAQQEPDGFIEPVDIDEVLDSATTLLHNMIKRSTRHFVRDSPQNLPPVRGSFRRLEQVTINLIQNACQALPDPSRAIQIAARYTQDTGEVILSITDEGSGITADLLPRITDPFFTTKRDSGGTGLGLSICATIINAHKGAMHFRSIPGKGTTVDVHLPAHGNSHDQESAAS